jgi:hypothetical protein
MFALDKGHLMFGPEAGWGESGGGGEKNPSGSSHSRFIFETSSTEKFIPGDGSD